MRTEGRGGWWEVGEEEEGDRLGVKQHVGDEGRGLVVSSIS